VGAKTALGQYAICGKPPEPVVTGAEAAAHKEAPAGYQFHPGTPTFGVSEQWRVTFAKP
jgi:hypothetical protein